MQNNVSDLNTPVLAAGAPEANASGVSWTAIFAGAAAAAALSLILIILGIGLGFSVVSPWSSEGASATAIGISTAVWLALTQIVSSGLGGYLAGRLRIKWTAVHADEVYFRDTAHGMLSWAVATLAMAALLGSALGGIAGTVGATAGNAASSILPAAQSATAAMDKDSGSISYFVDALFRTDRPAADEDPGQAQSEAATILLHSMSTGTISADDKAYLGKLVAQRTGLDQATAEKRITDLQTQAQQTIEKAKTDAKNAADAARKAAATTALWTFVALLLGAFFASLAALWGGRRRDLDDTLPTRSSTI